jgi:hypothetical protein
MPEEPEQIGPLRFVPNPDYPYPFDVPNPPRFWMEEQTGALADAVEQFMRGDKLKPQQIELLRLYLRQYLERAVVAHGADVRALLSRINKLNSTNAVQRLVEDLSEWGVEPF